MSKTALIILVFLGTIVIYLLALIIMTMIATYILKDDPDDYNYVMNANIIQFFVIMIIFAEKVTQWIN